MRPSSTPCRAFGGSWPASGSRTGARPISPPARGQPASQPRRVQRKILKIDHLGIAVNSIEVGQRVWQDVLGLHFEGTETVAEQKVTTAFFPVGESEVELLMSTAPDGPVAKYIEKKGQGIQHVAFRVENIEAALEELKAKGVQLIDQTPRKGAGGAKIAFLHPKATNGVLVELCER